jgi:double zinc ribbon protein
LVSRREWSDYRTKIQVMNTNRPATVERIRFPWWLIALAVVGFLGVQVLVYFATLRDPPPLAVRILLLPFAGLVVAFYILVAGYVNRDAKRRGMNSLVWTLLVIFIPNAIGFIIYFLTRRPLLLRCPQCSSHIEAGFTYCPGCSYKLTPTCPECNRSITITGAFCPYCGKGLRATAPARP